MQGRNFQPHTINAKNNQLTKQHDQFIKAWWEIKQSGDARAYQIESQNLEDV